MSKRELIRIIDALQDSENALEEERQHLEHQLQETRAPMKKAGSLTECGQKAMDILQQAQEQARQEAKAGRTADADSVRYAEETVQQARLRAKEMIEQARQDAQRLQQTGRQIIEKRMMQ